MYTCISLSLSLYTYIYILELPLREQLEVELLNLDARPLVIHIAQKLERRLLGRPPPLFEAPDARPLRKLLPPAWELRREFMDDRR